MWGVGVMGVGLYVLAVSVVSAQTAKPNPPGPTGLEIMKKGRLLYAVKDQRSHVSLRLITRDGSERRIVTKRFFKNFEGDRVFENKIVFFTEEPPDARGMGFMIWDYRDESKPDDLWLYLPALRQARRLSTRDQHDAFMGSDLTFGDMGQRGLNEDRHVLRGEATVAGQPCWVVESIPKEKGGLYSRRLSWISKADWLTLKIEYYDIKAEPLKVQQIEWQKIGALFAWRRSEVTNIQTDHTTILELTDLEMNVGLTDDLFTTRTLQTGPRD